MSFNAQVAVVTGASSGIGAELACQLAAAGARVGLVALPDEALHATAEAIRSRGGVAAAVEADVSDRAAVRHAVERLQAELGPIELLIANAGIGLGTPATPMEAGGFETLIRVNYLGVVYTIEAALPGMLERRRGRIVGISSLSSYRGAPMVSGYIASKAAVAALLEGLRIELKPYGISVTTVRPGFVRTPMNASIRSPRFLVEVEPAARTILKGVAEGRAEVRFPRRAAWGMGLLRHLPCAVYDRLIARAMLNKVIDEAGE